ncbi:hypothetical protein ABZ883_36285 [Streptomyces sp. NPDC046977]|uniref:hypothetical protein n=1 Tax=Streptomyces sp. NPDC046977 TaxID=3154703 RepID=UPI0033E41B78
MRAPVRSLMAAVAAALVVGAFAAPHAQADIVSGNTRVGPVVMSGGASLEVGSSGSTYVSATMNVSDPEGLRSAEGSIFHGPNVFTYDRSLRLGSCTFTGVTHASCSVGATLDALKNSQAGTWTMSAYASGNPSDHYFADTAATFRVLRSSKLVGSISTKVKGQSATVSGWLTRANWETHADEPYAGQQVLLQFCTATCYPGSYHTTDSDGRFRTTVTTQGSGMWKATFAGTADTAAPLSSWYSGYIW